MVQRRPCGGQESRLGNAAAAVKKKRGQEEHLMVGRGGLQKERLRLRPHTPRMQDSGEGEEQQAERVAWGPILFATRWQKVCEPACVWLAPLNDPPIQAQSKVASHIIEDAQVAPRSSQQSVGAMPRVWCYGGQATLWLSPPRLVVS